MKIYIIIIEHPLKNNFLKCENAQNHIYENEKNKASDEVIINLRNPCKSHDSKSN